MTGTVKGLTEYRQNRANDTLDDFKFKLNRVNGISQKTDFIMPPIMSLQLYC